jgi:glucose/arabinose dehydrogenase
MQSRSAGCGRWIGIGLLLLLVLAAGGYFLLRTGRGARLMANFSNAPAPTTVPLAESVVSEGINLPPGFALNHFAEGLNDPRMLALGPDGFIYLTERGRGRVIRLPDRNHDGQADVVEVVADSLQAPSGLAFYQDGSLYVAEPGRVLRFTGQTPEGKYTDSQVIIGDIPTNGHNTRTLAFSPDWQTLYVSIGSSCNVCVESDPRRAAISSYNPDGSGGKIYATGLRNAVGLTIRPGTDELWATNNGRDYLGDNLPPETINLVQNGDDFGWPRCHAGRIVDPNFGGTDACQGVAYPAVEMQAHSAPLGLTFYAGSAFPGEYQGDMFVAFHGSWNRTVPTGFKVVRIPFEGGTPGPVEDFAWGWLKPDGSRSGRPVDVLTGPDGALYISDDSAGIVYRVTYQNP